MRPHLLATIAVLLIGACSGTGGTTAAPSRTGPLVATREPTPIRPPTHGTFTFLADLRSSNQVPPITDAEASCTGQGRFVLEANLDLAGKITSATARFSFFVSGCPNSTRIALAHIHEAPAGRSGVVKIDSGLTANEPIAVRNGELALYVEDVAVSDVALLTGIVANPAAYYFNVHSVLHADGLLRGQLTKEN